MVVWEKEAILITDGSGPWEMTVLLITVDCSPAQRWAGTACPWGVHVLLTWGIKRFDYWPHVSSLIRTFPYRCIRKGRTRTLKVSSSTCSAHVGQLANAWTLSAYATDEALESIDDSLDLLGLAWVHVCPRGLGHWWIFFLNPFSLSEGGLTRLFLYRVKGDLQRLLSSVFGFFAWDHQIEGRNTRSRDTIGCFILNIWPMAAFFHLSFCRRYS